MINKQIKNFFGSNIFQFVGSGGMMGASYFYGSANAYTVPTDVAVIKTYAEVVVSTGPFSYYRLAEGSGAVAVDEINASAGASTTGTYGNGYTHVTSPLLTADSSSAVNFDGVDSYCFVSGDIPETHGGMTCEIWAICSASTPDAGLFGEKWTGAGDTVDFSLSLSGKLSGGSQTNLEFGRGYDGDWYALASSPHPFPLDRVVHALGVMSSGLVYSVWENGILQATATATVTATTSSAFDGYRIGGRFNISGTNPRWHGTLSDAAIYNRPLTSAEIKRHYAYGLGHDDSTYAFQVIADGAVGYWRLDGDTTNEVTGDVNVWAYGSYVGGPALDADPLVRGAGNAVNFDGSNDYLSLPDAPEVGANFTAEVWANCSASSPECGILSEKWTGGGTPVQYSIGLGGAGVSGNNTEPHFGHYTGGLWHYVSTGVPMKLNETQHIVGVAEGKVFRIYQNGIEQAWASVPASTISNVINGANIGSRWDSSGTHPFFDGTLSDVAVYATALTPDVIRKHYAYGKYAPGSYPFAVITDGATGYWRLQNADAAVGSTAASDVGMQYASYIGNRTLVPSLIGDSNSNACYTSGGTSNESGAVVGDVDFTDRTTESLTIEVWCSTSYTGNRQYLMSKGLDGTWYAEYNVGVWTGGFPRFATASADSAGGNNALLSDVNVADGEIHHLVFRHDNPNDVKHIYADGVCIASGTWAGVAYDNGQDVTLGHSGGILHYPFYGAYDELAIYATALTDYTIRKHLALGRGYVEGSYPFEIITDGASRYWRLNGANVSAMKSETGISSKLSTTNKTKINVEATSLIAGDDDFGVYFSTTGTTATTNPSFTAASVTDEGTAIRSVEGWIKLNSLAANSIIFTPYTSNTDRSLLRIDTTTDLRMEVYSGGAVGRVLSTPDELVVDVPYQFVLTYDGSISSLYVDGELGDTYVGHSGGLDGVASLDIGATEFSGLHYGGTHGIIDDVSVYATALTSTQVRTHCLRGHNATTYKQAVLDSNPFAYWRMGEDHLQGFDSIVNASSTLRLVRASANVSTAASSIVTNTEDDGGCIYFNQTGSGSTSQAMFVASAITSAGAPIRTFETWFHLDDFSNSRSIFATFVSNSDRMLVNADVAAKKVTVNDGVSVVLESAASSVVAGETYHFVLTYDDTTSRMYINGAEVDTHAGDMGSGYPDVYLGGAKATVSLYGSGNGWYDEFAVYASVLTPEEIKRHYIIGSRQFD